MSDPVFYTEQDFEAFYERNYKLVYRICYTYMKNKFDAEDCTEDVFVKILIKKVVFENEDHEKKWLAVVSVNLCKDRLKSRHRKGLLPLDEAELAACGDADETDALLSEILLLPEKYKDVILLHYYMEYKTEEIARMLHKPPSTIRNHLSEARKLLRIKLEEYR